MLKALAFFYSALLGVGSAGESCATLDTERLAKGGQRRRQPLLSSKNAPVLLQLRADGPVSPVRAGSDEQVVSRLDSSADNPTCVDDPTWKDPMWKAICADWRGYQCSFFKFGQELLKACPVTCGVCDPVAAEDPASTETTTQASLSSGLPQCSDLETPTDSHFQASCFKWKDFDCSGYSFSAKLEAMCPEECGLCIPG